MKNNDKNKMIVAVSFDGSTKILYAQKQMKIN